MTDRWYQVGKLAQPDAYAATVLLPDGMLWLTGGGASTDLSKAWADSWLITARPPSSQNLFRLYLPVQLAAF